MISTTTRKDKHSHRINDKKSTLTINDKPRLGATDSKYHSYFANKLNLKKKEEEEASIFILLVDQASKTLQ